MKIFVNAYDLWQTRQQSVSIHVTPIEGYAT